MSSTKITYRNLKEIKQFIPKLRRFAGLSSRGNIRSLRTRGVERGLPEGSTRRDTYKFWVNQYNTMIDSMMRRKAVYRIQKLWRSGSTIVNANSLQRLQELYREAYRRNQPLHITYKVGNRIVVSKTFDLQEIYQGKEISDKDFEKIWEENKRGWEWGTGENMSNVFLDNQVTVGEMELAPDGHSYIGGSLAYEGTLSWRFGQEINPLNIQQQFLDSSTLDHCFITPIKEYFEDLYLKAEKAKNNCKKKNTNKYTSARQQGSKYKIIINLINHFLIKYKDGVPKEDLTHIANSLQCDITISLPFYKKFIEVTSTKKRLKHFKFINTRLNHVEAAGNAHMGNFEKGYLKDYDYETKTQQELRLIKEELDNKKTYYFYTFNTAGIGKIQTIDKTYCASSIYHDTVQEFERDTSLDVCCLDDFGDTEEVSLFIREGTHFNSTVDFRDITYDFREEEPPEKPGPGDTAGHITYYCPNYTKVDKKRLRLADQIAAYSKWFLSKYYKGFVGKITDFRKTKTIEGIGIYRIENLNFKKNLHLKKLNLKMKIWRNNIPYPSPELEFLRKNNVSFDIVEGAWGVKFNFKFNDQMMKGRVNPYFTNNKGDNIDLDDSYTFKEYVKSHGTVYKVKGIRYYCKYSGSLFTHNNSSKYYLPLPKNDEVEEYQNQDTKTKKELFNKIIFPLIQDKNEKIIQDRKKVFKKFVKKSNKKIQETSYFNILKKNLDPEVSIQLSPNNNEAIIRFPRDHNNHKSHIVDFITSYQRISMMEQLLNIPYDDIVRVCVDGVYYYGNKDLSLYNLDFRQQKAELKNNIAGDTYVSQYPFGGFAPTLNSLEEFGQTKFKKHFDKEYHYGQGGAGKTYANLIDNGFVRVAYFAPTNDLVRQKKKEFAELGINIPCYTTEHLISQDAEKRHNIYKRYSVLIIDECSKFTENQKQAIFKNFSLCKLIFIGDIGYQLGPYTGEPMKLTGFDTTIEYKGNRRIVKDDPLLHILLKMRRLIDLGACKELFLKKTLKFFENQIVTKEEIDELYLPKHMIIASTHNYKNQYQYPYEKYRIHIGNQSPYCVGDILYEPPENYPQYVKVKAQKEHILLEQLKAINNLPLPDDIITSIFEMFGSKSLDHISCIKALEDTLSHEKKNWSKQHAYTVHSIQGTTFENILVIDLRKCNPLLTPQFIYTAVSRPRRFSQIKIRNK